MYAVKDNSKPKTQKQIFFEYMAKKGFILSDNDISGRFELIPYYYLTDNGDRVIISSMWFVDYGGSNVKDGDLGCVVFYYDGSRKRKYKKTAEESPEILKRTCCPKTAQEAIEIFEEWQRESANTISDWKKVI